MNAFHQSCNFLAGPPKEKKEEEGEEIISSFCSPFFSASSAVSQNWRLRNARPRIKKIGPQKRGGGKGKTASFDSNFLISAAAVA